MFILILYFLIVGSPCLCLEYALLLMDTLVDMVGNVEAGDEESPSQDTADPVVYQLVRVQLYALLMNKNLCKNLLSKCL